ncbi:MAG: hybrid sensor histidine kinase/response regulator, partial [bacterium]|nr:hybrid sensor histidine kinase/response regulator [bacterium]
RALNRSDADQIVMIATTADAYSDILEKIMAAGMNGRIVKPIMPDQLYGTIVRFMDETDQKSR